MSRYFNIFTQALSIGVRGFGGPATHLKLFSQRLVRDRNWISPNEFDGLVSLASLIPGPTSSQVGIALGLEAGGLIGALIFWIGFTLPSIILMYALSLIHLGKLSNNPIIFWILKIAICLVVLNSLRLLARRFASTPLLKAIAIFSFIYFLFESNSLFQIIGLLACAVIGVFFIKSETKDLALSVHSLSKGMAIFLVSFAAIFILLSFLFTHNRGFHLFTFGTFLQIGVVAFGGGHVVLPLLQSKLLQTHLISVNTFTQGYFFAQFMPGPLFTVAMFMGATALTTPGGFLGGVEALVGIFLPGSLLMLGGTYFWRKWSQNHRFVSAIAGINSAVLGLLLVAAANILRLH